MFKSKIAVAISGGVDSFYALKTAVAHFQNIEAVYLNFLNIKENLQRAENVALHFNVPFKIFDCTVEFKKRVINYFCDQYLLGKTPNPCIMCNKFFKFEYLLQMYDKVISGHYANIYKKDQKIFIKKGLDLVKDQSYFLARLDSNYLDRIYFPLGDKLKKDIKEEFLNEYKSFGSEEESQEICFIPDNNYKRFLDEHSKVGVKKGPIKTTNGKTISQHSGFFNFTIGQRKGLNIAMGKPYYVVKIDPISNTVFVGPIEETFNNNFEIEDSLWYDDYKNYDEIKVKVRYRTTDKLCRVDGDKVSLIEQEQSITPGQLAVFYHKNLVIGSGWIKNVN